MYRKILPDLTDHSICRQIFCRKRVKNISLVWQCCDKLVLQKRRGGFCGVAHGLQPSTIQIPCPLASSLQHHVPCYASFISATMILQLAHCAIFQLQSSNLYSQLLECSLDSAVCRARALLHGIGSMHARSGGSICRWLVFFFKSIFYHCTFYFTLVCAEQSPVMKFSHGILK